MSNVKNYTEQSGDKTRIGGELIIEKEGRLSFDGQSFTQVNAQSASTASDIVGLVADFNTLLTKLKSAGVMKNK